MTEKQAKQGTPAIRTTRPTRPGPSFFSLVPNPRVPNGHYEPYPMQKKIHYSKALYRVACLGRQVGKALPLDTPIPTPTGYTSMGELEVGDWVLDETGAPTRVTATSPVHTPKRAYEVLLDDGGVITASDEHNWFEWVTQSVMTTEGMLARLEDFYQCALPAEGVLDQAAEPRWIVSIKPVKPVPMKCISVENPTRLYLATEHRIVTHNSELASVEASFELTAIPGSKGWVVAPTFEQAQVIFKRTLEKVESIAEQLPHLRVKSKKGATLEIEVTHYDRPADMPGAKVLGKSHFNGKSGSAPDNLRGATLTYLIVDETAMMDESVWYEALKPMLSTTQGWVLFVSTPKGFNWFYEMFERGKSLDPSNTAWESFQAPSWDANPTVPREYYEQEQQVLPELEFRQEYGAEFVSNSGSVFQGVDSCPKIDLHPLLSSYAEGRVQAREVHPEHRYIVGADFGRLQDYTVYTVLCLDTREMVASYRSGWVDWDRQLNLLEQVSKKWNNALVVGDNNGIGDVLEHQIQKMGVPFRGVRFTGTQVKSEVINHLAIALEQGSLTLIDDPDLLKELRLYKYKRTDSGQLKMAAEGRANDDRVVSLALAYSEFEQTGTLVATRPDPEQEQVLNSFEKLTQLSSLRGASPEVLTDSRHTESVSEQALTELDEINKWLAGL